MTQTFRFLLIILFLTLAFLIRAHNLEQFSFWQDELSVLNQAGFSIKRILDCSLQSLFHPPLFQMIYKFWISSIPLSEFNIRLFSVITGSITCVLPIVFMGKIKKHSIMLALVFTINPVFIAWSKEALSYSFSLLLITLFIFIYMQITKNESNRKKWMISSILVITLVNYSNYFASIVANSLVFVGLIVYSTNKKLFKKHLTILLFSFLLFLPWILKNHLFATIFSPNSISFWKTNTNQISDFLNCIFFLFSKSISWITLFTLILFVSFAQSIKKRRWDKLNITLILTALLFSLWALTKSFFNSSILIERYFIFILPILLIFFINYISHLRKIPRYALLSIYLIAMCFSINTPLNIQGWQNFRAAFDYVSKQKIPGTKGKLHLAFYNPKWTSFYLDKFSIEDDFKVIKHYRTDCTNQTKFNTPPNSLKKNDLFLYIENECHFEILKGSLQEKNLPFDYQTFDGVSVLKMK